MKMGVVIRLRRIGKNPKKRPHFRISVFNRQRGRDSKFIEEIGFYSPLTEKVLIKRERLDFWLKKGARLSPTLESLIKKTSTVLPKEGKNATDNTR
jgi:small subunit ribosomal protein S16